MFSVKVLKELTSCVRTQIQAQVKPACKENAGSQQCGRSMIEMLGVLAIIGVLSVGGIAGFSKAMYKNKINKQAEQYSQIIAGVWANEEGLEGNNRRSSSQKVTSTFYALEIIPKEMKKGSDTTYFYDAFDNQGYIYHITPSQYYVLMVDIKNKAFDQCKNILDVARAYHEFVPRVAIFKNSSASTAVKYGDRLCTETRRSNKKCLQDMTVVQMEQACSECKISGNQECSISVYLSSAVGGNTFFDNE